MPFGYNGKVLHVDLGTGQVEVETPNESWYRTYMGGGAVAAYYLLNNIKPGTDPLGPDNVLVFAASVVTGAPLSGFSRYTVAALSPLTGAYGESEAGGYLGPELKFAGFDAVVIKGQADKPCYLYLHDGKAEIKDAAKVWGKDLAQTQELIRDELKDKKVRIAGIGPAGERQILGACVINELRHANGRCGLGAVMGSKNLKALVCRGESKNQTYADPDAVKALAKWQVGVIKEQASSQTWSKFGTSALTAGLNAAGLLPTRNWQDNQFEDIDSIDDVALAKISKGKHTCYRCAVGCKRAIEYKDERFSINPTYGGPEYETIGAMGSLCCVNDIAAVAKGHELCNAAGLDTIFAGGALAFAMELFDKGILTEDDCEGRKVSFGDAEGMLWLLERIISQKGLGKLLSQGVMRAADEIGKGAEKYAYHIKGQEIPLHDPRGKTGVGIGMATSPTGADHIEAPHEGPFAGEGVKLVHALGVVTPPDPHSLDGKKAGDFMKLQLTWGMNNVLGLCNFTIAPAFSMSYGKLVEAVEAITGWKTSLYELLQAAERSEHMYRVFNNRMGFTPEDDKLFEPMYQPQKQGPKPGRYIDRDEFKGALAVYYQQMGWDEMGRPTAAKLAEMELDWLAD
jgi:aldehyde:ferredoxin oxidoreductase